MEFAGLLAGALLALVIALLIARADRPRRARRPEPEEEPPRSRVIRLSRALSGDPLRDRPLLNRILALGPGVVTALLNEIAACHKDVDARSAERAARLEEVIADFGLAAVPPIADALARLHPTAPMVPGLVRTQRRLGGPGLRALVDQALQTPDLAPFLPRFRFATGAHDRPAEALVAALRNVDSRDRDRALDLCAGLLSTHPTVIESLWAAWGPEGRVLLLEWLTRWLPVATGKPFAARGLRDPDPRVRVAGAQLAALDRAGVQPATLIEALDDPDPRVRAAVARALAARRASARAVLEGHVADPDVRVAIEALLGLMRDGSRALPPLPAALTTGCPGLTPLFDADADPIEAALAGLEAADPVVRRVAAHALGRRHDDARARERLIRLVDARAPAERATAVLVLARASDALAGDLLVRTLRAGTPPADLLDLQEAAQRVGAEVAAPLARRLRPTPDDRISATLAVLRAVPYVEAVPPLLRGLEDARSGGLEGHLASTLYVGGPDVKKAISVALRQPTRGLLAPALRFLAAYGEPGDLELLIELFDRHPPLRSVVLGLIEGQGEAAIDPLRARVADGGDDPVLVQLEQRLMVLEAAHAAPGP